MEAVVDFLLEYYVWVLVVLVILLITVIGFLADTKKKKKLREKAENKNLTNTNATNNTNNEYLDYNNMNMGMNNGFNMNTNLDNNMLNPNMNNFNSNTNNMLNPSMNNFNSNTNNMLNPSMDNFNSNTNNMLNPSMDNFNSNMNNMLNPSMDNFNSNTNNMLNSSMESYNMGINNLNSNTSVLNEENNDTFFVPASEQTPKIEAREVVIPKPIETAPIMNNSTLNNLGSTPSAVVEPTAVPPLSVAPVEVANNIGSALTPQMESLAGVPTPNVNIMPQTSPINNLSGQQPMFMQNQGVMPNVVPNVEPTVVEAPVAPVNNTASPVSGMPTPNVNIMSQAPIDNLSGQQPMFMPNQGTMPNVIPNIEPTVGNVVPNNNIPNMTNSQIPNQGIPSSTQNVDDSYLRGGSTFVMGNPNNNMNNQIQSENDNWKL